MKTNDLLTQLLLERTQERIACALITGSSMPPTAGQAAPPDESDRKSLTLAQLQVALRSAQPTCYIAIHPEVPAGKVLYGEREDVRDIVLIAHPDLLNELIQDMASLGYRVQVTSFSAAEA